MLRILRYNIIRCVLGYVLWTTCTVQGQGIEMHSVSAEEGSSLTLGCRSTAHAQPSWYAHDPYGELTSVEWRTRTDTIAIADTKTTTYYGEWKGTSKVQFNTSGNYLTFKLNRRHNGLTIFCIAIGNNKQFRHGFTISVTAHSRPKIVGIYINGTLLTSSAIVLRYGFTHNLTVSTNASTPYTVQWSDVGRPTSTHTPSLAVLGERCLEGKILVCSVSNQWGTDTVSRRIVVYGAPFFIEPQSQFTIIEGEPTEIGVKFYSVPVYQSCTWTRDGSSVGSHSHTSVVRRIKVQSASDSRRATYPAFQAVLKVTKPKSTGVYTLTVVNSVGSVAMNIGVVVSKKGKSTTKRRSSVGAIVGGVVGGLVLVGIIGALPYLLMFILKQRKKRTQPTKATESTVYDDPGVDVGVYEDHYETPMVNTQMQEPTKPTYTDAAEDYELPTQNIETGNTYTGLQSTDYYSLPDAGGTGRPAPVQWSLPQDAEY